MPPKMQACTLPSTVDLMSKSEMANLESKDDIMAGEQIIYETATINIDII